MIAVNMKKPAAITVRAAAGAMQDRGRGDCDTMNWEPKTQAGSGNDYRLFICKHPVTYLEGNGHVHEFDSRSHTAAMPGTW
jgi:hypothetical protein